MDYPKVYILLLNYNGWQDTLECLESIYKLSYANYQPIVVDNQSTDNSVHSIIQWAEGHQINQTDPNTPIATYTHPRVDKPVNYSYYRQHEVENKLLTDDDNKLIIIQADQNSGFAAGNNIGIKYAIARGDFEYIWILNNDTVVEPSSLAKLVAHAQQSGAGITGAMLRYYDQPAIIQCVGGSYYQRWVGVSRQIGNGETDQGQYCENPPKPDLIIGACMLVSRSFLTMVGPMYEGYFLYFEEQDWAERARRLNIQFGVVPDAIVYHKEGATIGSKQQQSTPMSDYYHTRNKILFTRRFFGIMNQLSIRLSLLLTIGNRIRRGQWERIPLIINAAMHPEKPYAPSSARDSRKND